MNHFFWFLSLNLTDKSDRKTKIGGLAIAVKREFSFAPHHNLKGLAVLAFTGKD